MLRNQKIHCHRSKLIHENEKLNCKNHSGDLRFLSLQFPWDHRKKKLKVHYTMKSLVCITKSNTLIKKMGVCVKMNSRTFLPDLHLIPKNAYPDKIRMLAGSVFLEQRKLLFFFIENTDSFYGFLSCLLCVRKSSAREIRAY